MLAYVTCDPVIEMSIRQSRTGSFITNAISTNKTTNVLIM